MKRFLEEFKEFIARGNVIDLAVAVVLGIAFKAVVDSLVNDVIMAGIGSIAGKPNFNDLTVKVGDGVIAYGRVLTALVTFLLIGFVLFLVVKAFNAFRRKEEAAPTVTEKDVLVEIRDLLASRERNENGNGQRESARAGATGLGKANGL